MTPGLPPSKKKRPLSHNAVLVITCLLASVGILTYLFYPRQKPESNIPTPQQQAAEAPEEDNHAQPEEEDTSIYHDPTELTEQEIAKLPPWEAAFARLSKEQRLTFATIFAKAKQAYAQEQWAVCLSLLHDCELIYANSPNIWNLRSCALLKSNDLEQAEFNINHALELNPEDSVALLNQADLLMMRRDYRNCISTLSKLRSAYSGEGQQQMHDIFAFRLLLCHLMLRQEMEARAIVAGLTPLTDSPLYYFAEAAFAIYKGDSNAALDPLRAATTIYGNGGVTASYRKWMDECGLQEKYIKQRKR